MQLVKEISVDNFCGGGGVGVGYEKATGRSFDIAINHDPDSITMHEVNHPLTRHYCQSVWEVDPREAANGRPVALCWLSPACDHFSIAANGKPKDNVIRSLAWVGVRWAATVKPRVIMLENVKEFKGWGPLLDGQPDPKQKGRTFNIYINAMKRQGYQVEHKELKACDYGAPTSRERFFMIARSDSRSIVWPKPTHGDPESIGVRSGKLLPWRTAAEIIDWSIPCPSIFERKKPLVEKTLVRIARGLKKFILDNPKPFIAPIEATVNDNTNLVLAFLSSYYGETVSNDARGQDINKPLHTITTANRFALVTSHLVKFRGSNIGQSVTEPLQTITAGGIHHGEVRAFFIKYYGAGIGQTCDEPLHTIPTKDRFGLITIHGQDYQIVDIGFRMLKPHELFAAQGFPDDYVIDRDSKGNKYPISAQVARVGNSVSPLLAEALIKSNFPEFCSNVPYHDEYQFEMQLV